MLIFARVLNSSGRHLECIKSLISLLVVFCSLLYGINRIIHHLQNVLVTSNSLSSMIFCLTLGEMDINIEKDRRKLGPCFIVNFQDDSFVIVFF